MGQEKKRPVRRRRKPNNGLVINILMLIVIALIVFEGKTLIHLFSKESLADRVKTEVDEVLAQDKLAQKSSETVKSSESATNKTAPITEKSTVQTETATQSTVDPAYQDIVVPKSATAVDDSYFNDAVFIGDSRMEGFKNQSGITEGTFLTAVGMSLDTFYDTPYIATAQGTITVLDALKKSPYKKVYMMIGTNELGTYDFNELETAYTKVLADIKAIQQNAIIYIYSVIYVEEELAEFDYVNNKNVDTVNEKLLKICKENGYHYIDLNEVLSDGNRSLIKGATADGVHLNAEYLKIWLDYTRNHYLPDPNKSDSDANSQSDSQVQSQPETKAAEQ